MSLRSPSVSQQRMQLAHVVGDGDAWHQSSSSLKSIAMDLRVSEIIDEKGTTLRVDGRLSGSAVAELVHASENAAVPLTLDLSGLLFADADGVNALKQIHARGARLCKIPPYVALLLEMEGVQGRT
jgi:anti-anti-sigma regulatory factor